MQFRYTLISVCLALIFTNKYNGISGNFELLRGGPIKNTQNNFNYSFSDIPQDYSPTTTTTIKLLQSKGLKFFFCDLSQTSVPTNEATFVMVIQNRYANRYSNSDILQMYLSIYTCIVVQDIKSLWETYLTNNSIGETKKVLTATTHGISALLTVSPTNSDLAITALANLYILIKNMSVTNSNIDSGFTSAISIATTKCATTKNNSLQTTPEVVSWMAMCDPKLDNSDLNAKDNFNQAGINIGGVFSYDLYLYNTHSSSELSKKHIKYIHYLTKIERSFLVFGASSDRSIISNIISLGKNFANITNPIHVPIFSKPVYGTTIPRGSNLYYDCPQTGSKGIGGILNLGPISLESILTSIFIVRILRAGLINPYRNYIGINVLPYAGMIQLRMSTAGSAISGGDIINAWSNLTSNLTSRYSSTINDADFTTYVGIISQLTNYISPGSSSSTLSIIDNGLSNLYFDKSEAYVFWMEMFYGAFDIVTKVRSLASKSTSEQATFLKSAVKPIIATNCTYSQSIRIYLE